jgi:hypothetical protein
VEPEIKRLCLPRLGPDQAKGWSIDAGGFENQRGPSAVM